MLNTYNDFSLYVLIPVCIIIMTIILRRPCPRERGWHARERIAQPLASCANAGDVRSPGLQRGLERGHGRGHLERATCAGAADARWHGRPAYARARARARATGAGRGLGS